jgi:hypothetical protein
MRRKKSGVGINVITQPMIPVVLRLLLYAGIRPIEKGQAKKK